MVRNIKRLFAHVMYVPILMFQFGLVAFQLYGHAYLWAAIDMIPPIITMLGWWYCYIKNVKSIWIKTENADMLYDLLFRESFAEGVVVHNGIFFQLSSFMGYLVLFVNKDDYERLKTEFNEIVDNALEGLVCQK